MRKGFTLVELAIVLVIIGLIMGMAIKGKSMIDVARFTREIHKVVKLQAAMAMYEASGTPFVKITRAGIMDYEKFMERGGVSEGDLRSALYKERGRTWSNTATYMWWPLSCRLKKMPDGRIAPGYDLLTGADPRNTWCGVIINTMSDDSMLAWVTMPWQAQCGIENMLDDKDVLRGDGRRTDRAGYLTEFTEAEYADCLSVSPEESNTKGSGDYAVILM